MRYFEYFVQALNGAGGRAVADRHTDTHTDTVTTTYRELYTELFCAIILTLFRAFC